MKLRTQVLTVSLATLLVPWFGWKLVQELERFLRAGQETALLASAYTVARALPAEFQSELLFGRHRLLHLQELPARPHLDGYTDDWPEPETGAVFESPDGLLRLRVAAGRFEDQVYLLCRVYDPSPVRETTPAAPAQSGVNTPDGVAVYLRTPRDMVGFRIQTAAPGPLLLNSHSGSGGQLEGYWLDHPDGYAIELSLPVSSMLVDIGVGAQDAVTNFGRVEIAREAGTIRNGQADYWLSFASRDDQLGAWLESVIPAGSRAWVVDGDAWVMADSGAGPPVSGRELSFIERMIYRAVAGSRTEVLAERPGQVLRFDEPLVSGALNGAETRHWGQDPDSALVRNSVAVPIELQGEVHGAVVLEANSDSLLLVTNRVLGRLLLSMLLLTVGITAGLWFFATRLSRRVQRLSGAVSEAMDDTGRTGPLPMTGDRDELGELARNNAKLLTAVKGYTSYLKKLAGRLSHELKTPLAITRSSLDNLASTTLDEEASRYVQRAREGLDRQSAIVAAMSEANRLEAAVESAEWDSVDLLKVVGRCVEAYRELHPGRRIEGPAPGEAMNWYCAPDLLAQALDKLVENAVSLTGADDRIDVGVEKGDSQFRIYVRNSGTRLPDVPSEQLFDSLVSLREKGGGRHLGLGLHIVRLVAEAHGGRASARNLDAGVEFTITIAKVAPA
ncbi:MAG: hypothetical protein HKO64_07265 [Xanthomonadales bacterium]|nr:hypothetical protein [Gammaproteobacteria bacterium]NNE04279.1 hypothetical protein [Xanthomonadales bacterium]NNL95409.1 hypothetical protein [Xanthomonadales bacterium]